MKNTISLIISDWKRYTQLHSKRVSTILFVAILFHNPGMFFSLIYRIEHYLLYGERKWSKLLGFTFYPIYYFITYYIFDIDIPPSVRFGKGLYVHNRGITITDGVKCGDDISLIGPLTIGKRGLRSKDNGVPHLGSNVTIYSGARIFGGISIGDNVDIAANAVVGKSFSSNKIIAGVPAEVVKKIV